MFKCFHHTVLACLLPVLILSSCTNPPAVLSTPLSPPAETVPAKAVSEPIAEEPAPAEDLILSVHEAVLTALENNRDINLKRLDLAITKTDEQEAAAEFRTTINGAITNERIKGVSAGTEYTSDALVTEAGVERAFSTGTDVNISISSEHTDNSLNADPEAETRIGLSITQALLQGRSITANTAAISQARIDSRISEYELQGYAMLLTAIIEKTCWDYVQARDKIGIYEDSLKLAEDQLYATREKIEAGRLPRIDLAAAQAEVALRQENLINAKSTAEETRLKLLRLLNPNGAINWSGAIGISDLPEIPDLQFEDVEQHAELGLQLRPDLNQARLKVKYNDLEVVRTRNGLLPKLDLFIRLGQTGYAESFSDTVKDFEDNHYDAAVGLSFSFPSITGSPDAQFEKAHFTQQKSKVSLNNMQDLVQYDIRSAYVKAQKSKEQVIATNATRKVQNDKLQAEIEKFKVGRSTSLQVAQVQRESVESRIAEKEAVIRYLKALIDLYQADGSLLQRRRIEVRMN